MKHSMRCLVVFLLLLPLQAGAAEEILIPLGTTGKQAKIITVSPRDSDFTDPAAALASITDAAADNRYLVLIGPGVYTLTQTLAMKPFVDIAGAGQEETKLAGAIGADTAGAAASLVTGADHSTLRDLTIENWITEKFVIAVYNNTSSPVIRDVDVIAREGENNIGISNDNASSPEITDVSVTAYVPTGTTYGIFNGSSSAPALANVTVHSVSIVGDSCGVHNYFASATLTNVTIRVECSGLCCGMYDDSSTTIMSGMTARATGGEEGYGVYNSTSSPTMTNVIATASGSLAGYGLYNVSSFPVVRQSTLDGSTAGVFYSNGTTRIIQSSIMNGTANEFGGTLTCVHSDNGIATALSSSCQ